MIRFLEREPAGFYRLVNSKALVEMTSGRTKHKDFCFAGQPAPSAGYFPGDVLPCICGAEGDVMDALRQIAPCAPAGGSPAPPEPAHGQCQRTNKSAA